MEFRIGWVVAVMAVAMALTYAWTSLRGTRPVRLSERLQPRAAVEAFELTDQGGKPFGLGDLKGKIWVANFVSMKGESSSLLSASRMAELNKAIGRAGAGLELVSFSLDQGQGQTEGLAAYASKLGAEPGRWKFLAGDPSEVAALVGQGMLKPLGREGAASSLFVLVDREGRLRGFQDGNDPEVVQKLLMDIGDLLRESPNQ